MITRTRILTALVVLVPIYILSTGNSTQVPAPGSADTHTSEVDLSGLERGRHLVAVFDCHACHTPKRFTDHGPVLDETRLLSGHPESMEIRTGLLPDTVWTAATNDHMTAWSGPWGISFAPNLTPDLETGLGGWTEQMFIRALRTGRHMGEGRPILPPMPWQAYRGLTDDELNAMFAYLQTVPPVSNIVPEPIPPAEAPRITP